MLRKLAEGKAGTQFNHKAVALLRVPVFYLTIGFGLIGFGTLVVVITEISLITSPAGMNAFVLHA